MIPLQWLRRDFSTLADPLVLTPKHFYDLAMECRAFTSDLARLDPTRVHLASCHRFNDWLPKIRRYDRLAPRCQSLRSARPIAQWQVLILGVMSWLVLYLVVARWASQRYGLFITNGWLVGLMLFYFVPEHFYGTTVELLEARLLLIVDSLLEILQRNELPLTEAVYFRLKAVLEQTHHDLREQIDLAHR